MGETFKPLGGKGSTAHHGGTLGEHTALPHFQFSLYFMLAVPCIEAAKSPVCTAQ